MYNEHIHKYYRFRAWLARQDGKHLSALFFDDFARQERTKQLNKEKR